MIKKFLKIFLIIFAFIIFIYPAKTNAANSFTTDYNVTYNINENGTTRANLKVTLTNTTSEYYASSYKIQVGFDKIENISASDDEGQINPVIEKTGDGYILDLNFNKKASGIGKKLNFNISFDTPDVAKKYGKIWEINIPGIANPDDFDSFLVTVKVPPSFGKPSFTKPYQPLESLVFDKKKLGKSGISISFGDKQVFSFHLTYHIKNENLYPIRTEIALPPTTNYQEVFIQNINPKPINVKIDTDGNWLAQYDLDASQKADVTVDGKAEISLLPKPQDLSPQDMQKYLEDKPYWQSNSSEIKQIARELKTPDAIYKFVIKALKYDFSRVANDKPRLGALGVLKSPDSAVCLEYTDLFIALARAAGIPAREVDGYGYTENSKQRPLSLIKDILHAWPEYYDSQRKAWIMVDPTWGSTTGGVDYFDTLDFDHFAFVIKGVDSSYPVPAGGYKFVSDKYTKDVAVDFAQNAPEIEQNFEINPNIPKNAMTAAQISGKITVRNTSQNLLPTQKVLITTNTLAPHEQTIFTPPIPPFGTSDLTLAFQPESFLTKKQASFTILVNGQSVEQKIDISPLGIKNWWVVGGGFSIGVLIVIIFIFALKGRRL